jgi:hypothetical protein
LDLIRRVGFDTSAGLDAKSETPETVGDARPANPSLEFSEGLLSRGWVIEADGRIVGHLGNLPARYRFHGRDILAAVASGLIVDPEFRGMSIRLVAKFANQPNADLLLNTTTAPITSKMFKAFRFNQVLSPEYDRALYWVCDAYGFAGVVAARLRLARTLTAVARPALAFAIAARRTQLSRRAVQPDETLSVSNSSTIGESGAELDALWETIQKSCSRLLADRSADAIAWHFGKGEDTGRVRFLRCMRDGQLVGYVVLGKFPVPALGMRRMRILDLVALDEATEIIDALLMGARAIARAEKSHILELIGFPTEIRERALITGPFMRRLPGWPYLYKTKDAQLAEALGEPETWYACPYDGDASVM